MIEKENKNANREEGFYDRICRPNFEELKTDVKKILMILQGNGDVGLCEKVRIQAKEITDLKNGNVKVSIRKISVWAIGIVVGSWLFIKSPIIFEWLKKLL